MRSSLAAELTSQPPSTSMANRSNGTVERRRPTPCSEHPAAARRWTAEAGERAPGGCSTHAATARYHACPIVALRADTSNRQVVPQAVISSVGQSPTARLVLGGRQGGREATERGEPTPCHPPSFAVRRMGDRPRRPPTASPRQGRGSERSFEIHLTYTHRKPESPLCEVSRAWAAVYAVRLGCSR